MTESLLTAFDRLKDYCSEDTLTLLLPFIEKLKNDRDKREYISAFFNYCSITAADILTTPVRSVDKYFTIMSERVHDHVVADSTRRKHRKIITAFYNDLDRKIEEGLDDNIPLNYVNNFTCFSSEHYEEDKIRRDKTPQPSEIDALIGEAKKSDKELLIVVLLAYQLYLRTGEIAALKVSDFGYNSESNDSCFVTITRSGQPLNFPVSEELAAYIEQYLKESQSESRYLFCEPEKSDAWIRRTQYRLANLCVRAFSDSKQTYSLNNIRNAAGATAVTLGIPETDVADAMGYKSYRHIRRLSSLKANVETKGFMNIKIIQ